MKKKIFILLMCSFLMGCSTIYDKVYDEVVEGDWEDLDLYEKGYQDARAAIPPDPKHTNDENYISGYQEGGGKI